MLIPLMVQGVVQLVRTPSAQFCDSCFADNGQLGNQRPREEKGRSRLDEPEIFRSYVLSLNVECQAAGVCVPLRFFGLSIFPLEIGERHVQ